MSALRDFAKRSDIHITVFLPPSRPGSGSDRQTLLRNLLNGIDRDSLPRVEQTLEERGALGGGPGLALFIGESFVEIFEAPVESSLAEAGPEPYLLPLLFNSQMEKDFFILGVSRKSLRLLHYANGRAIEEQIPPSIPLSFEEFRGGDDRELVPTSKWHESEELALYFHRVDVGLHDHTRGHRIVLLGVEEDLTIYRHRADRSLLFTGEIHSSIRDLTLSEITQRAGEIAHQEALLEGRARYAKMAEWPDRRRISNDLATVELAAREGRVQELHVPLFTLNLPSAAALNRAAVETLRHSGEVLAVDGMTTPVLALLRY